MAADDLRYIAFIQDVLISLHENMRELNERKNFAAAEEFSHIQSKIIAYQEVLAILQTSAAAFDLPKSETGL